MLQLQKLQNVVWTCRRKGTLENDVLVIYSPQGSLLNYKAMLSITRRDRVEKRKVYDPGNWQYKGKDKIWPLCDRSGEQNRGASRGTWIRRLSCHSQIYSSICSSVMSEVLLCNPYFRLQFSSARETLEAKRGRKRFFFLFYCPVNIIL